MVSITINLTEQQLCSLCADKSIIITTGEPVTSSPTGSFFQLFTELIQMLKLCGSQRTSETYRTALYKFRRFVHGIDLPPSAITAELMEQYQLWLRSQQLTLNTVSFHMRILRAVYHKAVDRGMTIDSSPFRHVYTGQAKTVKRALPMTVISQIKNYTTTSEEERFARDMFLFSFYTRGMAFVDMAYLRHSDLHDGMLFYKRRKTGQQLCIRWEQPMQDIVDRYRDGHDFLLPIIRGRGGTERSQYRRCQEMVNRTLKKIGQQLGIQTKLTLYCTRHSWATIAKEMNLPLNVISRALGHTNEHTTEIYLKSIDMSTVDNANAQILEQL